MYAIEDPREWKKTPKPKPVALHVERLDIEGCCRRGDGGNRGRGGGTTVDYGTNAWQLLTLVSDRSKRSCSLDGSLKSW